MKKPFRPCGFTLVELLVVIAIITILISLFIPSVNKMIERSRSVACMNNLKQIGTAMISYVGEHDNTFPYTEVDPVNPVYPTNYDALPMLDQLTPYGLTASVLKCPSDVAGPNYYATRTNSYMWIPVADDESVANITIYGRRGGARVVKPSRVRICMDYDAFHSGRFNKLYADGHVSWTTK